MNKPAMPLIERCIDVIAKRGQARSTEIADAVGNDPTNISALLRPEVEKGLLICCKVSSPSGRNCNEYRLAGHVPAARWRDFRISKNKQASSSSLLPAPHDMAAPAAQPKVAEKDGVTFPPSKNHGSRRSVAPAGAPADALNPPGAWAAATAPGEAALRAKNASAPNGQVEFGLWNDGRLVIRDADEAWVLNPEDTRRLARFILDTHEACLGHRP